MLQNNANCPEAHEMAPEISKLTSELAAQAAFRAQQLLRNQDSSEEVRKVPAIPARSSDVNRLPPEIPPKRNSLKQIPPEVAAALSNRIPPPLPQKPITSAKNSPLPNSKFNGKMAPPPMPTMEKSTNPFDYPMEPPSVLPNSKYCGQPDVGVHVAEVKMKISTSKTLNKRQSPTEEYGSEDALRGIESGLRNMERAMQEQMNLRSMEATVGIPNPNFPIDFKALAGGGGGPHRPIGALNQIRGWERNLEQLKLNENIGDARMVGAVPAPGGEELKLRQNPGQMDHNPRGNIEHHMRSLDRNLPLELQYSRFRNQQQQYQMGPPNNGTNVQQGPMPLSNEFREHIRQQLMGGGSGNPMVPHTGNTPVSPAAAALLQHQAQSRQAAAAAAAAAAGNVTGMPNGLSREELRMRRRSSHDETQMPQGVPGIPVTRLREHWDDTSQVVLQRSAQLKNMLGDSQRYEAKRLELEKWLARMENRAERMGAVATTADVLEAQQKEQKSFHAELHQNKQQIELFNTLTQKLIAVYPSDDTSRIKKMTESVNVRYANLNNGVINRGKQLHAALHSLQSFDRTMDQFLAFLSESESLVESAESDIDRNPLMFRGVEVNREVYRQEVILAVGKQKIRCQRPNIPTGLSTVSFEQRVLPSSKGLKRSSALEGELYRTMTWLS